MVSSISGCTLDKAMKELGEVPERRMEMIGELREKLKLWQADPSVPDEEGLTLPLNKIEDDPFLLRFLRARKFDIERSTKLFVNYFKYRSKYSSMLGELSAKAAERALKENIISVLPHRSEDGCKILVAKIGRLDLDEHSLASILKMMLVILDQLIEDEDTQVHGIVVCEDLSEISFFKMMSLIKQEQVAKGLALELIQDAFPARFKGFHIINQPWYISLFMTVVRPFMKQKTKDRFHMHGEDYSSLHQFIAPEKLPSEFGGQLRNTGCLFSLSSFQLLNNKFQV